MASLPPNIRVLNSDLGIELSWLMQINWNVVDMRVSEIHGCRIEVWQDLIDRTYDIASIVENTQGRSESIPANGKLMPRQQPLDKRKVEEAAGAPSPDRRDGASGHVSSTPRQPT